MRKQINDKNAIALSVICVVFFIFSIVVLYWDETHTQHFPLSIRLVYTAIMMPVFVLTQLHFWDRMLRNRPGSEDQYVTLLRKINEMAEVAHTAKLLAAKLAVEGVASSAQATRIEATGLDTNATAKRVEERSKNPGVRD